MRLPRLFLAAAVVAATTVVPVSSAVAAEAFCNDRPVTLVISKASQKVTLTSSADVVLVTGKSVVLDTGAGHDVVCIDVAGGTATVTAGDGDDYVQVWAARTVYADLGAGRDTFWGRAGTDYVYGGTDADVIRGHDGNDRLAGGPGDDIIEGDEGNDTLWGGAGNDELRGIYGSDTLYGGNGDDYLSDGVNANERNTLWGDEGVDTFEVAFGTSTVYTSTGDVNKSWVDNAKNKVLFNVKYHSANSSKVSAFMAKYAKKYKFAEGTGAYVGYVVAYDAAKGKTAARPAAKIAGQLPY